MLRQLTIEELIEKLRQYDMAAKVSVEGCDCDGIAVDVEGCGPRGGERSKAECTDVLIVREYDKSGMPRR